MAMPARPVWKNATILYRLQVGTLLLPQHHLEPSALQKINMVTNFDQVIEPVFYKFFVSRYIVI
jgi:hypothetical protein